MNPFYPGKIFRHPLMLDVDLYINTVGELFYGSKGCDLMVTYVSQRNPLMYYEKHDYIFIKKEDYGRWKEVTYEET